MTHEPMLINEIIKKAASPEKFVAESEAEYESKLDRTAWEIAKSASERPFILISGPSGSGKTQAPLSLRSVLIKWALKRISCHLTTIFTL